MVAKRRVSRVMARPLRGVGRGLEAGLADELAQGGLAGLAGARDAGEREVAAASIGPARVSAPKPRATWARRTPSGRGGPRRAPRAGGRGGRRRSGAGETGRRVAGTTARGWCRRGGGGAHAARRSRRELVVLDAQDQAVAGAQACGSGQPGARGRASASGSWPGACPGGHVRTGRRGMSTGGRVNGPVRGTGLATIDGDPSRGADRRGRARGGGADRGSWAEGGVARAGRRRGVGGVRSEGERAASVHGGGRGRSGVMAWFPSGARAGARGRRGRGRGRRRCRSASSSVRTSP
jgi:hypothetical protein